MSQPPSKAPVFGNSAAVFVSVFAAIGVWGYAQFAGLKASGSSMTYAAPAIAGAAAAALILPLVLGVAAYWVGARSTKAARATACVAATLMAAVGVFRIVQEPARSGITKPQVAQVRKQQAEAVRSGDTQKLAASGERTAKAIEASAKDASVKEREVAILISKFARELNELAIAQNKAFDAFNRAGGIDPTNIKTQEELNARIALLATARTHVEKYGAAFDGARKELGNRLAASGASERIMHEVLTGFESASAARDKQRELNLSNVEFCDLATAMLGALKTHWGKWSVTEQGLAFSADFPKSEAEAYARAQQVVAEIAVEQDRMTEELAALIAGTKQAGPKQAGAEKP